MLGAEAHGGRILGAIIRDELGDLVSMPPKDGAEGQDGSLGLMRSFRGDTCHGHEASVGTAAYVSILVSTNSGFLVWDKVDTENVGDTSRLDER
jgi:hypothetical protein